ncbi:MAG TPA: hypothetical protein PKC23_02555 [Candidatus Desulfobacillus sp.]|nr:hypothetical protein [Candidatus Desulfobacillus sp.]
MSKQPIVRANPQTAEDKQTKHYVADWWVYLGLAFFIGGLIAMTYFLTLRGDAINEFGKPGSHTEMPTVKAPAGTAQAAQQAAPASPAAAEEKK